MNILVYNPTSQFAVYISSVAIELNKKHHVILLTQSEKGEMHDDVEKYGLQSYGFESNSKNTIVNLYKQLRFLLRFIKQNKIEVVISHNHPCNFVSVFAQMFCNARFILCRHHTDIVALGSNRNAKAMDSIINFLGKEFIVPGDKTINQMVNVEGVLRSKIYKIPYAYNFNDYPSINNLVEVELREKLNNSIVLITVGRLIEGKRIEELIKEFTLWNKENGKIKLLVLGDGPNKRKIEELIELYNQSNNVFLLGRKQNILDYINASDLVIHISESETSCSVTKEAGICRKPVVVCDDVGDFNEYISHNVNGFVVPKYNYSNELKTIISAFCANKEQFKYLGNNLHDDVYKKFSIENIIHQYYNLLNHK